MPWWLVAVGLGGLVGFVIWACRQIGFAAQRPGQYRAAAGPALDLTRHLSGEVQCDGVIYGPLGRVVSRFSAEFMVTWANGGGIMTERFLYEDGSVQTREWRLHLHDGGRVTATAHDVVGEGQGQLSGPTLRLRYRLRLPEDAGGHLLDVVDWMYLTPNGTIVNRSRFYKWGITVAELVATMRRKEAT